MTTTSPSPSFDKTYRRADGEEIGDYGWVTSLDILDDFQEDPVEIIEETWERVAVRTYWMLPTSLYDCTKVADCDEDAIAWEQLPDDGNWVDQSDRWVQTCAQHAATKETK